MIYLTKQEGLYQNKVNFSLVSTCNCKMDYSLGKLSLKQKGEGGEGGEKASQN